MSRGRKVTKKPLSSDPKYNSRLVSRFINNLMVAGKKSIAQKAVYESLAMLDQDKDKALQILQTAVANVTPSVEVRSRRVGGANYQVPVPVRQDRGEALALRWIIDAVRKKKGASLATKLSQELLAASKETGEAMHKKEVTYKMAEANRAFSHFRW